VQHLLEHYITNSAYCHYLDLKPGNILIMDNFRMAHGREAFDLEDNATNARLLRRTWIFDDSSSVEFVNIRPTPQNWCRAFERLEPYSPIENTNSNENLTHHLGVHITPDLQAILDRESWQLRLAS
ncbi:MAG: TauD/TfdA family dioxygenase, partial [Cyanothece sp. SIO2G6]|nr:TauD/TfdA family dioxygenase [Cyanothece sp. SIO2G6]